MSFLYAVRIQQDLDRIYIIIWGELVYLLADTSIGDGASLLQLFDP